MKSTEYKPKNYKKIIILLIVILLILSTIGFFVFFGGSKKSDTANSIDNSLIEKPVETKKDEGTALLEKNIQSNNNTTTYNLLDTNTWDRVDSKNGTYSIKLGVGATYGYCAGDDNTLAVGLIYMDASSNEYDCNSVSTAIYKEGRGYELTMLAIGLYEQDSSKNATRIDDVQLINGQTAKRYEFNSEINNQTYKNIEYVTKHQGTDYMARLTWQTDEDISSYVSPDYLDTIVQKTWVFN